MERKEAIEVIKKNWPDSSFTMLREALESLIPELAESEDEKIRKWLIHYFKEVCDNVSEKEKKGIVAWLEKQYEKGTIGNEREIPNSAWSEEDERVKYNCIAYINKYKETIPLPEITGIPECINWLKNLNDRVQLQPRQDWSEEDENIKESIITGLEMLKDGASDKSLIALYNKKIEWLKSIRPQNTWKPSEEQMEALEHFVRSVGESGYASPYDNNTKLLYSLLFDLKKLKE